MSENERDVQRDTETAIPNEGETIAEMQKRLKAVNAESAGRRKEIDALQAKIDQLTNQQLADQQKWQELAQKFQTERDELKPYKAQAESVSGTLQALLDAQLAELPDEARTMVCDMPGTAQEKLDWLAKNRARLLKPLAPPMDPGARGDSAKPTIKLTDGQKAAARAAHVSEEQYIAALLSMEGKRVNDNTDYTQKKKE